MKVTLLGHAELLVEAAGRRVLLDPWIAEPVFAGAWYRYPPRPYRALAELGPIDHVVLSHEHPDHAGVDTLRALPPGVPIHAMRFESPTLARNVERAGRSQDAVWHAADERIELAPGLFLTLVPHSGGWQVASAVLEAEGVTLYHGNDNALPVEAYEAIARRFPRVDVAFLPFAGASSYPTCFAWSEEVILERCAAKKREGVARFEDGIRGLRPRAAAPFASSWALLEPGAVEKNYLDRPSPEEAIAAVRELAATHGTALLAWSPGDEWGPSTGLVRRGLGAEWRHDRASVRAYAEQERERVRASRVAVATVPDRDPVEPTRRYLRALLDASRAQVAELDATVGLMAPGVALSMRFAPGAEPVILDGVEGADEVLELALADLWAVLVGTWLWEDLWYGYRIHVRKRDETPYFRAFWDALLFFDDFELKRELRGSLHLPL